MEVEVKVLGWINKCCGCNKKMHPIDKTYIISEITGLSCSIHLCEDCISKIVKAKQKEGE